MKLYDFKVMLKLAAWMKAKLNCYKLKVKRSWWKAFDVIKITSVKIRSFATRSIKDFYSDGNFKSLLEFANKIWRNLKFEIWWISELKLVKFMLRFVQGFCMKFETLKYTNLSFALIVYLKLFFFE